MLQSLGRGNQIPDGVTADDEISQLIRSNLEFLVNGKDQGDHGHGIRAQIASQIHITRYRFARPLRERVIQQRKNVIFYGLRFHFASRVASTLRTLTPPASAAAFTALLKPPRQSRLNQGYRNDRIV
jgi:hypothetical protein